MYKLLLTSRQFSALQAKGVLSLIVPDEPPVTLQSGGISVLGRVGRLTSASHYSSQSGDFHAVYPAGSVECPRGSNDLLAMSAVSYRTSIGEEPASPTSLLRVVWPDWESANHYTCTHMHKCIPTCIYSCAFMRFVQTIETSRLSANKCHVVPGKSFQYVFASHTNEQLIRISGTQKHNQI